MCQALSKFFLTVIQISQLLRALNSITNYDHFTDEKTIWEGQAGHRVMSSI